MSAPGPAEENTGVEKSDQRRPPQDVLNDFEDQMKRKVKQFDLRVLNNKRRLEKIRGRLTGYLDECRKVLERRLAELDDRVDGLADKVDIWEKNLMQQQAFKQGND